MQAPLSQFVQSVDVLDVEDDVDEDEVPDVEDDLPVIAESPADMNVSSTPADLDPVVLTSTSGRMSVVLVGVEVVVSVDPEESLEDMAPSPSVILSVVFDESATLITMSPYSAFVTRLAGSEVEHPRIIAMTAITDATLTLLLMRFLAAVIFDLTRLLTGFFI